MTNGLLQLEGILRPCFYVEDAVSVEPELNVGRHWKEKKKPICRYRKKALLRTYKDTYTCMVCLPKTV